jgi:hypothetical protein
LWSTGGRWLIVGWEKEIKRLGHLGILSEDLEFWDFNLGIFYVLILLNVNGECEEKREDWFSEFAFDLLKPIGGRHLAATLHSYSLRVNSFNRWWNRDFTRFHPILTILPDFDPILPDSEFYTWFST